MLKLLRIIYDCIITPTVPERQVPWLWAYRPRVQNNLIWLDLYSYKGRIVINEYNSGGRMDTTDPRRGKCQSFALRPQKHDRWRNVKKGWESTFLYSPQYLHSTQHSTTAYVDSKTSSRINRATLARSTRPEVTRDIFINCRHNYYLAAKVGGRGILNCI